jgi:hypothetical protein
VAKAFIESVGVSKSQSAPNSQVEKPKQNKEVEDDSDKDSSDSSIQILLDQEQQLDPKIPLSADDVLYAVQFCHLCSIGKVSPVLYSLASDPEVSDWFKSVTSLKLKTSSSTKRRNPSTPDSDSDSDVSSPDNKVSKKDHYLINTMRKLHDTMVKNYKSKEEKEPGFKRLETNRKNLILNASATPPFTKAATNPTEFFTAFLAKKSQFKAKDMLVHRFHNDKIAFNPNPTFITNLWNSEFFWLLPDSPSSISIFYCPQTKASSSYEMEKEQNLALADKLNTGDLEKLSKQKISIPSTLMDLVWTTQNFHAIIALCFGTDSHSASFLQDWINHMYDNRLKYTSYQTSDPYFFAKVMFTIDNALQTHWRSCSSAPSQASVNDNIPRMQDIQNSILGLSFNQMLPKTISDKVLAQLTPPRDDKNKGNGQGKFNGKKFPWWIPRKRRQTGFDL